MQVLIREDQGCISCGTCSYLELTEDHVLTSAYVKIFRIVTRNAVNKSFWRKKDCSWPPLNKYAMNIWLSSLKIRAHLSWRTGKHLHVLHVLRTYPTCSYPGYQDTTTYAASQRWWSFTASITCNASNNPQAIFNFMRSRAARASSLESCPSVPCWICRPRCSLAKAFRDGVFSLPSGFGKA